MQLDKKPMWKRRVSVVEAIYSELIISQLSIEKFKNIDTLDRKNWLGFENQIFDNYLKNKEKYMNELQLLLKSDWEISRINTIAVAILLEAVSEFYVFKTPKGVLISQSIKTAKNYCGDHEYRIINGLLENFLSRE